MTASSNHPIPCLGYWEDDYLNDCLHYMIKRAGSRKYSKRKYNKRVRRYAKVLIQEYLD